MIDQHAAEKAQEFVFDNAETIAKAKAEMNYLEEFRKSKRSILQKAYREEVPKSTIQQCEDYAQSHPDYLEILIDIRVATEVFEKIRFEIESARMKVNIWQTQSANQRV